MGQMPKVSKDSAAQVDDYGPVENRHEEVSDYTIEYVQFSPILEHQAVAAAMVKNMQEAGNG
jgi:hypothetical protein